MRIPWDFVGFHGVLMGFNGTSLDKKEDFIGFNGILMGFEWD